jgi:hypothetical protein
VHAPRKQTSHTVVSSERLGPVSYSGGAPLNTAAALALGQTLISAARLPTCQWLLDRLELVQLETTGAKLRAWEVRAESAQRTRRGTGDQHRQGQTDD